MTNRDLIKELLDHDLDADVQLLVVNGFRTGPTFITGIRVAQADDGTVEISEG